MGVNQHYTRIDTSELKALLHQKIGQQRADKYFNLLNKLFTLQLSKNNFDKFCIRTIGRENLPLHNRLITSILKNATQAKVPPPTVKKLANTLNVKITKTQQRNNLQSLVPLSPRKSRSPRKLKDRFTLTPLGPHQSPTELHSLGSRPPVEVLSVEDGEEVVSGSPGIQSRSPVTAPLGISITKARKSLNHGLSSLQGQTCQNSFELPDSGTLRGRLRQKLGCEGLSVSEDCANLLNLGLDAYLKRLIEPCIALALARSKVSQRARVQSNVSVMDFSVAMECDSSRLVGDWSTLQDKISLR